jgi:Skp family chaperone for outer membrane proteins
MRKLNQLILAAAVLAVCGFGAAAKAADAPAAAATFGFVDTGKVFQSSEAAKGVLQELEGKRKEYQAQITKEENSLRAAGQEFEKQKSTLGKSQLEAKRKEIDKRLVNGQKMVQERKAMLDKAYGDTMAKLRGEIMKIVADIAKEKGLSAVFTQEAVMLSAPEMDLTAEVIKHLNDKVKKISVEWPSAKDGK